MTISPIQGTMQGVHYTASVSSPPTAIMVEFSHAPKEILIALAEGLADKTKNSGVTNTVIPESEQKVLLQMAINSCSDPETKAQGLLKLIKVIETTPGMLKIPALNTTSQWQNRVEPGRVNEIVQLAKSHFSDATQEQLSAFRAAVSNYLANSRG